MYLEWESKQCDSCLFLLPLYVTHILCHINLVCVCLHTHTHVRARAMKEIILVFGNLPVTDENCITVLRQIDGKQAPVSGERSRWCKGLKVTKGRPQTQIVCKNKGHLFCRNIQHVGVNHSLK